MAEDAKDKRIKELEAENTKLKEEYTKQREALKDFDKPLMNPNGYILNRIFRDQGTSKNVRLDEIQHANLNKKRGEDETEVSPYTATDVAKAVIEAVVIQDDSVRNLLMKALEVGLCTLVKDPTDWEGIRRKWANNDDETYKADHRVFAGTDSAS